MTYLFIILHYHEKTLNYTFNCVESIKNLENKNNKVQIMIVDNGSNDSSDTKLREIDYENVEIISLKKSLGYSNSINQAATLGVKKYNPDFIVSANNDTLIKSKYFYDIVFELYDKYRFSILGPKIINNYYKNQNPYNTIVYSEKKWLENALLKYRNINAKLSINNHVILKNFVNLKMIFKMFILKFIHYNEKTALIYRKIRGRNEQDKSSNRLQKNVALQGAFLIFSKDYFKRFKYLFYPNDYFYFEEDIIFYLMTLKGFLTLYTPDLEIRHFDGTSTNAYFKKNIDKEIWKTNQKINSLILFKNLINFKKNV